MRKLASIQLISSLQPIKGADRIELASVRGWEVVVQKDQFKVGEKVVYLEVDSWVPLTIAPFLQKGQRVSTYNGVVGERLRTVKLRGQISQGLVLHLPDDIQGKEVGFDLTELMHIQKWEPEIPACLGGTVVGGYHPKVPKTDQERIQNLDLNGLRGMYEVTEKLDGSSCSFYFDFSWQPHVFGRNWEYHRDEKNSYWKAVEPHLGIESDAALGLMFQGEVVGPGIQGNKYRLRRPTFFLYNIWDIWKGKFWQPRERREFADFLGISQVPMIDMGFIIDEFMTQKELLAMANGNSRLANTLREGLVFKDVSGKAQFKVIDNGFLIREEANI